MQPAKILRACQYIWQVAEQICPRGYEDGLTRAVSKVIERFKKLEVDPEAEPDHVRRVLRRALRTVFLDDEESRRLHYPARSLEPGECGAWVDRPRGTASTRSPEDDPVVRAMVREERGRAHAAFSSLKREDRQVALMVCEYDEGKAALGFQKWRANCHDDLEFYLRIFHHWSEVKSGAERRRWAAENGVSDSTMRKVADAIERNLQQFSPRTHDRLTDRRLDMEHLHRTRLVIARCMPTDAFSQVKGTPHLYKEHKPAAEPGLVVQIDQESACAGNGQIQAFISASRRRDGRAAYVVARHIIRVAPEWLETLPNAGPIARACLLREAVKSGQTIFVDQAKDRVLKPPPLSSRGPVAFKCGDMLDVEVIREGGGKDQALILAVDRKTREPVLLETARRPRQSLVPGSPMRGSIAKVDSKRAIVYLTQDRVRSDYIRQAGKPLTGKFIELRYGQSATEFEFAVIELEPGIEGVLFVDGADSQSWQALGHVKPGAMLQVVVVAEPEREGRPEGERLRLQTVVFAKGAATHPPDTSACKGILHSYILDKDSGARSGVRVELAPGHLYRMYLDGLPKEWKEWVEAKWKIGQALDVVIVEPKRRRVFPKKLLDATIARFPKGSKWDVTIANVIPNGAFVTLSGELDGFIPIREISWEFVEDATKHLRVNSRVSCVVIDVDADEYSVCLSIKQTKPHPWESAEVRYPTGSVVSGKVCSIKPYGAYVSVEPAIDGLLHVSELAWRRVDDVASVVAIGETVRCVVLSVDGRERRLELSIKRLQPDPWSYYSSGMVLTGTVARIEAYGAFIDLEDGVTGLVHVSELAWSFVSHPRDIVKIGQRTKVKVLSIEEDGNRKKMKLSMKQVAAETTTYYAPGAQRQEAPLRGITPPVAPVVPPPKPAQRAPAARARSPVPPLAPQPIPVPRQPEPQEESLFKRFKKWLGM